MWKISKIRIAVWERETSYTLQFLYDFFHKKNISLYFQKSEVKCFLFEKKNISVELHFKTHVFLVEDQVILGEQTFYKVQLKETDVGLTSQQQRYVTLRYVL